jgi:Xaa-Pro aminopeptidase
MYADHRKAFFEVMEDGVAFVPASVGQLRNNDTDQPFRQNSDFMHLCGFDEPEAIAVFIKGGKQRKFILFVPPRDPALETWTGRRAGTKGARRDFGADEAWDLPEFDSRLPELLKGNPVLYLPLGPDPLGPAWSRQQAVIRALNGLLWKRRTPLVVPASLRDVRPLLAGLRLRKSAAELEHIEAACAVTARAFAEAMACTAPGVREYQVKAVMQLVYGLAGGTGVSTPSWPAGPTAACCTMSPAGTSCRPVTWWWLTRARRSTATARM